ncbi:hypothetical protein FB562_2680, partial [Homoserinimonas aerilata]
AATLAEPLLDDDVADSTQLELAVPTVRPARGEALTIG